MIIQWGNVSNQWHDWAIEMNPRLNCSVGNGSCGLGGIRTRSHIRQFLSMCFVN